MEDRELYRDLSRLIRGDLSSAEAKRLAQGEGCRSFSELCGTRLPEELSRVRIGTRDLLGRIDRFRRRATDLYELWFWADELYHISFNHTIAYEPRSEELILTALSAISVVANEKIFPNREKTARAIEYVRACLIRRRKIRLRNVFFRIFEDLERASLATKRLDEDGDEPPEAAHWSDVVLLDAPFETEKDFYADYDWMIAFTVTTRFLSERERLEGPGGEGEGEADEDAGPLAGAGPGPGGADEAGREEAGFRFDIPGWREPGDEGPGPDGTPPARPPSMRPTPRRPGEEVDRVPALRRLVPNFDFERYRPTYVHDGDGIAEIVLDAPSIGREELRYAAKLFCLANRIRTAALDGEELPTLVVKPGSGRRAQLG